MFFETFVSTYRSARRYSLADQHGQALWSSTRRKELYTSRSKRLFHVSVRLAKNLSTSDTESSMTVIQLYREYPVVMGPEGL